MKENISVGHQMGSPDERALRQDHLQMSHNSLSIPIVSSRQKNGSKRGKEEGL